MSIIELERPPWDTVAYMVRSMTDLDPNIRDQVLDLITALSGVRVVVPSVFMRSSNALSIVWDINRASGVAQTRTRVYIVASNNGGPDVVLYHRGAVERIIGPTPDQAVDFIVLHATHMDLVDNV